MTSRPVTTGIVTIKTLEEIIAIRDNSIRLFEEGHKLMLMAINESKSLEHSAGIYVHKMPCPKKVKKDLDIKFWRHLFNISGMEVLMNTAQKDLFEAQLLENPPELTIETVKATLMTQYSCKDTTFINGMVDTFKALNRDYKTNNRFKVGHKVIFHKAADKHGHWNSYNNAPRDLLIDLERIIYIVNSRKPPTAGENISNKIHDILGTVNEMELDYLKCKTFLNGNVHIEITCSGTINRLNEIVAEHFGHSLPQT